jgi:hypothetical protein
LSRASRLTYFSEKPLLKKRLKILAGNKRQIGT